MSKQATTKKARSGADGASGVAACDGAGCTISAGYTAATGSVHVWDEAPGRPAQVFAVQRIVCEYLLFDQRAGHLDGQRGDRETGVRHGRIRQDVSDVRQE